MRSLVFETYGNNEIRIGFNDLPARRKQSSDPSELRQRASQGRMLDKSIADELSENGHFQYRDEDGTLYRGSYQDGYEPVDAHSQLLDILSEFQEQDRDIPSEEKRGYGAPVRPTSFGRDARHRILEAGALFDRKLSGAFKGYFATLTLPGSRPEAYDVLSRWSGYVANRLLQTIRDRERGALWFYVWELQKRGALHMHLFIALPAEKSPDDIKQGLRDAWYRALFAIGAKESVDIFLHKDGDFCTASSHWQYDFQLVQKSPAQYISKYVSKSAIAPMGKAEVAENVGSNYPHRWWGMCRELKRLVDENRFRVCMDAMSEEDCMDALDDMSAMISEFEPVQTYEYTAEIVPERGSGRVYGKVHRRIFYIRPEDFPIVDVLFRKAAIAYMRSHPKHNQRWKYQSTHYEGVPVWEL